MNIEELREICLRLPGVTEDIKWVDHLCFSVGNKMFVITAPDAVPVSASFKTNDDDFDRLTAKEGFIPAPYLAKNKWIHVDDISRLSSKQWITLMQVAYDLIFEKLTTKLKKEIKGDSFVKKTALSGKEQAKKKTPIKTNKPKKASKKTGPKKKAPARSIKKK